MVTSPQHLERVRINFSWILKLRWAAAAGQLATIFFVYVGLAVPLPIEALGAILLFEALSNIVLTGWFNGALLREKEAARIHRLETVLGTVMLVDILLLTLLLYLTGGPSNPFSVFFMVNIVLSAVVLQPRWTLGVLVLALACFAGLQFHHLPIAGLDGISSLPNDNRDSEGLSGRPGLYLKGLLVAFGTAAAVIVVFVTRLKAEIAHIDSRLEEAVRKKERSDRLEALGTLAAGAAHELASPLSTIAVVARDLEIALEKSAPGAETVEDARLVRQEVTRCRAILDRMSAEAGQSTGEGPQNVSVDELLDSALDDLTGHDRVILNVETSARKRPLRVQKKALALALRQVIKNALDASPGKGPVNISVNSNDIMFYVVISDRGSGMSPETIARATDPFFTTKEPGKGMGLGLFLSQTVVERVGGQIRLTSESGHGTEVRVEIPWAEVDPEPTSRRETSTP